MSIKAKKIAVTGLVQGVGFRPFVYRIALQWGLNGSVSNNSQGVFIVVEGEASAIKKFETDLVASAPPLSHILSITPVDSPVAGYENFVIKKSETCGDKETFIAPDSNVCPDCVQELFDTGDRRYRYPFINCTNCGPRYSIIGDVPYDRSNTTMKIFPLCDQCQREYDNPADRRFHAEPVACPLCGPQVIFRDNNFELVKTNDPIATTIYALRRGDIVAIKGIGGYHLAVDAFNESAVIKLRQRKRRVGKPFAVMVADIDGAKLLAKVSEANAALLHDISSSIVLLPRLLPDFPKGVAPLQKNLGLFLPYTPIHHLLFREGAFGALVMTSANISDDPLAHTEDEAHEELQGIADAFLTNNRPILNRSDDSIERPMAHAPVLLRRARGYTPVPILLGRKYRPTLAIGTDLKNSFCYLKDDKAFISQHIGDLTYARSYRYLEESLERFLRLIDADEPEIVAIDKHPDSSAGAIARAKYDDDKIVTVQHHHAHMVSAMAEQNVLGQPTLGIIFDGTGFGDDGSIWGGEFLFGDEKGYERVATTRPLKLPGGDKATRQPWRIARALLDDLYGDDISHELLLLFSSIPEDLQNGIVQMSRKMINTPLSHGVGRLFDAASALLGLCGNATFEGEGAILLESMADENEIRAYRFEISETDRFLYIDWEPAFRQLIDDHLAKTPVAISSARFHNGLVDVSFRTVQKIATHKNFSHVALSGGCFQNRILCDRLGSLLASNGYEVVRHSRIPPNDGGVSLGQAIVAALQI